MKTGKLDKDWVVACRVNWSDGNTLEGWVARVMNCEDVEIDDGYSVCAGGVWLDQDGCDMLMRVIDGGV